MHEVHPSPEGGGWTREARPVGASSQLEPNRTPGAARRTRPLQGRDKEDHIPSIVFALPPASAARIVSSKPATELMCPIGSFSSMSNG